MSDKILAKFVNENCVSSELEKIGFDSSYRYHAIKKNTFRTIKIFNLRPQEASILKQTALSLGFDAAVHRGVLDCSVEHSDALLTGSFVQFQKLSEALKKQPFKMKQVAEKINSLLGQNMPPFKLNGRSFDWRKPYLMGILNVTPDSFSDGGKFVELEKAVAHFVEMVESGADIIDIGAESTRPNHEKLSVDVEIARLKPILSELQRLNLNTPISVDTRNVETAKMALELGVDLINDVGNQDFNYDMIDFVNANNVSYVVTHNKTIQADCVDEVYADLDTVLAKITAPVIVDVGIGFGKTVEQNFELLSRISEFKSLGKPLLVGHSRKSFLTKSFDFTAQELEDATVAVSTKLMLDGVNILRVHAVKKHKLVLDVVAKI